MMSLCPKCGDYYADQSLAFCLADGTPLVSVEANSERWIEGAQVLAKKENALTKRKQIRTLRRVSLVTMVLLTMLVYGLAAKRYVYLVPVASPSPTPTPSPTPMLSPSPTPSPSPSPTPSPTPLYKITGRVTTNGGPLAGVNIMLKSAKSASTKTDSNGNYTFADLPGGGSYTITPEGAKTTFTPPNRTITNLTQDGSADFSAVVQPDVYKISGRVTEAATAKPLTGVKIILKGAMSASTTTDSNGKYSFADLPKGGSYTITPDKDKTTFTPRNRAITNLTQDGSADFSGVAQPDVYKISGRVTEAANAKPLGAVNITLSGAKTASTKTDPHGNYSFGGLPGGARYTITPDMGKINFMPPSRSINNLARDESADFSGLAQPKVYKISGRVMDADKPLGGVSIKLGRSMEASTTTDANGVYRFSDLPAGGSYTISPDKTKGNFTPSDHLIGNLMRDESADFARPPQECSEADKDRDAKSIMAKHGAEWRQNIEAEHDKIIATNVRASDGNAEATLSEIAYQRVFKGCTVIFFTARYRWQITTYLPTAPPKVSNVTKHRLFSCVKRGGEWSCPPPVVF